MCGLPCSLVAPPARLPVLPSRILVLSLSLSLAAAAPPQEETKKTQQTAKALLVFLPPLTCAEVCCAVTPHLSDVCGSLFHLLVFFFLSLFVLFSLFPFWVFFIFCTSSSFVGCVGFVLLGGLAYTPRRRKRPQQPQPTRNALPPSFPKHRHTHVHREMTSRAFLSISLPCAFAVCWRLFSFSFFFCCFLVFLVVMSILPYPPPLFLLFFFLLTFVFGYLMRVRACAVCFM